MALAYFITFTTYGARLHGDENGSVDREHNRYDTPFLPPDNQRQNLERDALMEPPFVLCEAQRQIVCQSFLNLAAERGWKMLAVHVRSNHVHVVIQAERLPERIMTDLKARASRDLNQHGFDDPNRRRWTRHGSTRHLFREESIDQAIRYTLDEQGDRMAWYVNEAFMKEPRTQ